ncbi:hypothetical protein STAS_26240 [Striga asiatica]|uniref:Uncharacterized protein n=1 Tax=Striga asiatica TaxID=4170 RepID=A0A5A7QUM2_STRAF|nr:hypothetical protein STAS_26240 [Striga asiatica]
MSNWQCVWPSELFNGFVGRVNKIRRVYELILILACRGFCADAMHDLIVAVISAAVFGAFGAGSVAVPSTSCYAVDNTSHIHDFSDLVGQIFEYDDDKNPDLVVRFCKDVETRSQPGYVDFGRFDKFNYFTAGSGHADFVQEYYSGDLMKCEKTFDKLGRTAQLNIICGNCPNGQCVGILIYVYVLSLGGMGCICKVTYESSCRVLIDLAIPCVKPGLRVFEGFTVGFHPRSWEIVYNGMTQLGYEKLYDEFSFRFRVVFNEVEIVLQKYLYSSNLNPLTPPMYYITLYYDFHGDLNSILCSFRTEQRDVTLYLTAVASVSNLVQKPTVKTSPEQGLVVQLSGSGADGRPPTTLSPTMILVDWRCEKTRSTPYEVEITIPVENYDPIQFTLAKMCEHSQGERGEATRGWAIFGIISCISIVAFTLLCIGGFIYRTRVTNLRGLDAVPGMAILSACLETASGGLQGGYTRPDDANNPFANQTSWDQQPNSTQRTWRASERTYGSI